MTKTSTMKMRMIKPKELSQEDITYFDDWMKLPDTVKQQQLLELGRRTARKGVAFTLKLCAYSKMKDRKLM